MFLSGLPLSWPVRIFGLVVHYTANYLIRRRPILWHKFKEEIIPDFFSLSGFTLTFARLFPTIGQVTDVLLSLSRLLLEHLHGLVESQ